MTATPVESSENTALSKFGRAFRKAGNMFGIDLADLFEDEEGQPMEGLEGFAPTFRLESQLKGRSPSTLTYKAPKTPSRTATFELAPVLKSAVGTGTNTGTGGNTTINNYYTQAAAVPPIPPKKLLDRTLESFIGELGDPNRQIVGASAIGAAKEYGYTTDKILQMGKAEGLKFGGQAAKALGIGEVSDYIGSLGTAGALGAEGLKRAREAGLSDQAIKQLAKEQGLTFGQKAAQQLGVRRSMPRLAGGGSGDAGSYVGSQGTPGSVGAAALERSAAAQGISMQQAAQQAQAQGYNLGDAARSFL